MMKKILKIFVRTFFSFSFNVCRNLVQKYVQRRINGHKLRCTFVLVIEKYRCIEPHIKDFRLADYQQLVCMSKEAWVAGQKIGTHLSTDALPPKISHKILIIIYLYVCTGTNGL